MVVSLTDYWNLNLRTELEQSMARDTRTSLEPAAVRPQLITAARLAEMLSISKRSLQRLQSRGAIPAPLRVGGAVRWRLDAVEEWIEAGCDPLA